MKSPLRYQYSEYDSGATAILNGISFVLEREKINPNLISSVYRFSLDTKENMPDNMTKDMSNSYNTKAVMSFVSRYINESVNKGYKLNFKEMNMSDIDAGVISSCLTLGGCVIIPINVTEGIRYVTLTSMNEDKAYFFDPYYMSDNDAFYKNNKDIIVENAMPFSHNRVVSLDRLFSANIPYSIASCNLPCFLLTKKDMDDKVKFAKKFDYLFND